MGKGYITLAHGAGGKETEALLRNMIFDKLDEKQKRVEGGVGLDSPDDAAAIPLGDGFVVVTIDSYTVSPLVFPGGDIGSLAASGSINDVLMMGGKPIAMLDAIVVEEGFDMDALQEVTGSMMSVLKKESIPLIGGDLKTMPKGQVDKVLITTAGIGTTKKPIVDSDLRPGDKVIVTGTMGDHGATILAMQQGVDVLRSGLKSDSKPLTKVLLPIFEAFLDKVHAARDPTRGGLAMALNDWAAESDTVIVVEEANIPVKKEVRRYLSMLGIDPLYMANEGAAILGVDPSVADEVLQMLRERGAEDAAIVGEARRPADHSGIVLLKSEIGGFRLLEPPTGSLVPRIC
jgi:hydrogenase expression/formation protein HypE